MSVQTTESRKSYLGNNLTTVFPIPFKFMKDTAIKAFAGPAESLRELNLGIDFTVSGAGDDAGGNLTTTTPVPTGEVLVILRETSITQECDYSDYDNFPAETHESVVDKLTMIGQEAKRDIERAIQLHPADDVPYTMPLKKEGYFPKWGPDGLVNSEYSETEYLTNQAEMVASRDAASASAAAALISENTAKAKATEAGNSADSAAGYLSTAEDLIADAEANSAAQIQAITNEGNTQVSRVTSTGDSKLAELNSVVTQATNDATEAIQDCEDAAARAQSLPVGQVISGFWKTAPEGTLALLGTQWPIASFSDLWADVLKNDMAVPKAVYDAELAAKGSVSLYGIDEDGLTFWLPKLEDIYVVPATPGKAGFEAGDIREASLPEIEGTFKRSTTSGVTLYSGDTVTGAFSLNEEEGTLAGKTQSEAGDSSGLAFKASLSDSVYGADGDSEVRTKRAHLLFCVVAYNGVVPASVADMTSLLASISQLQTETAEIRAGRLGSDNCAKYVDEKPWSVSGGTATSGAWMTRELNKELYCNIEGMSLNEYNAVIFPPGIYRVTASQPLYAVRYFSSRLADAVSGNDVLFMGHSYARTTDPHPMVVRSSEFIQLEVETAVVLQYWCEVTKTSEGLGLRNQTAGPGIFGSLEIMKVG